MNKTISILLIVSAVLFFGYKVTTNGDLWKNYLQASTQLGVAQYELAELHNQLIAARRRQSMTEAAYQAAYQRSCWLADRLYQQKLTELLQHLVILLYAAPDDWEIIAEGCLLINEQIDVTICFATWPVQDCTGFMIYTEGRQPICAFSYQYDDRKWLPRAARAAREEHTAWPIR